VKQKLKYILICLISGYILLLIPDSKTSPSDIPITTPFEWNNNLVFHQLEKDFILNKLKNKDSLSIEIDSLFFKFYIANHAIKEKYPHKANDHIFKHIESLIFKISSKIVYTPSKLKEFSVLINEAKYRTKQQSKHWDLTQSFSKNTLYRIFYGSRTALEEIELQSKQTAKNGLMLGVQESSITPYYDFNGLKIHSGDILVSRGGAATSALIARGSDYPGNFSHVALAYVDETTNALSIIESHIEMGVVISTPDQYMKDKKLRVMVLRPKANLPELLKTPNLPHLAAKQAYNEVLTTHIPYDFAMDYNDYSQKFCSEVASSVYAENGLPLWMKLSSISSPGITDWLSDFGVKNFITQEPSDLEYDPQLTVVAEWRGSKTLFQDHIDNAIIDILIEDANKGEKLSYNWYLLPFARVTKAYSWIKNIFGGIGPIPEGMSTTSALKNKYFTALHLRVKNELMPLIHSFEKENGYTPPYWRLVELSRIAKDNINGH